MRVLLLKSKRLPAVSSEISDGGTAHVFYVASALVQKGNVVTAVVRAEANTHIGTGPYAEVRQVVTKRSQNPNILERDYADGSDYVAAIPEELLHGRWDVVYVHHWTSVPGLVSRLPATARIVYTPHLLAAEKARVLGVPVPPLVAEAERQILRRADHVVCLSEAEARRVAELYGVCGNHVHVIPNGVATLGTDRVNVQRSSIRVTSIGRLSRQKGYDVLLEALDLVPAVLAARMVVNIYGPSYDEHSYEALVRDMASRSAVRVMLKGELAHGDVPAVLASTDIYIQPSRYESQGIALQEAMAAGVACIATRIPAITEYVDDGANAHLVPVDDADALARALVTLSEDADLREHLGAKAATSLRLSSWSLMTTSNIRVLQIAANGS